MGAGADESAAEGAGRGDRRAVRRLARDACGRPARRSWPASGGGLTAGDVLARAGVALADRGEALLATAPHEFDELNRSEWDALDRRLSAEATSALRPFDGVEGGYFLRDHRRFLGASFPTEPARPEGKVTRDRSGPNGPPPREADLIEIQADAAIRLNRDLLRRRGRAAEHRGDPHRPRRGRRPDRRRDVDHDAAGRPAVPRPLAAGLSALGRSRPGRDRPGAGADDRPVAHRPAPGRRARSAPGRASPLGAAGGAGQAARGRRARGSESPGRHPVDRAALAARDRARRRVVRQRLRGGRAARRDRRPVTPFLAGRRPGPRPRRPERRRLREPPASPAARPIRRACASTSRWTPRCRRSRWPRPPWCRSFATSRPTRCTPCPGAGPFASPPGSTRVISMSR